MADKTHVACNSRRTCYGRSQNLIATSANTAGGCTLVPPYMDDDREASNVNPAASLYELWLCAKRLALIVSDENAPECLLVASHALLYQEPLMAG